MMKRYMCAALVMGLLCGVESVFATGEPASRSSYRFSIDANNLVIRADEEVLLHYRYGDAQPKSYVREVFTPNGIGVLLDSPPDHVHHHALMFACAVDGVDFWADDVLHSTGNKPGRQKHRRFPSIGADSSGRWLGLEEDLTWVSPADETPMLQEQRIIRLRRSTEPAATLLTWRCRLAVPEGKKSAVLTGSHYHGLGLRFIRSMDAAGEFRNPDNNPGTIFRGEERLRRSRWCAYTARANGKVVTVAMFDDPDNPRHPATWFTMAKPFAYMSATLKLHEEPLNVLKGKPLALRYGVALWDGRAEMAQIDALYKQWIAMAKNKPEK